MECQSNVQRHIPKRRITWKDWTKARLNPRRETVRSCGSVSSILGTQCHDMSFNRLEQPHVTAQPPAAHMVFLAHWFYLGSKAFSCRYPICLAFHGNAGYTPSFTYILSADSLPATQPCYTLPDLTNLYFKSNS